MRVIGFAFARATVAVPKTTSQLSERQAQVAALVAAGKSNREIAAMLSVAERTVETRLLAANAIVTLTGAGGIGKTRIAVAIGGELQAGMRGGVWFADLAPLRDSNAVVAALALALGIAQSRNASLLESVTAHLRLAQALVILDNCVHVIDEVARVADAILNALWRPPRRRTRPPSIGRT